MESSDTVKLLKECDAGSKMAVESLNEVLKQSNTTKLQGLLEESLGHHEKLGNKIHELLNEHKQQDKDPNPIAKSMSYMKTTMKINMDNSDATVADLLTDGCDMGIKSLHKYLNQYKMADSKSKQLTLELISIEEELELKLREYL